MLQKSTQWITDRIIERALPSIGGYMASALQRMLVLGHAEHHSELEEQARKYEEAGKPHLAEMIRSQSQQMRLDAPLHSAERICENLTAKSQNTPFSLSLTEIPEATNSAKSKSSKPSDGE